MQLGQHQRQTFKQTQRLMMLPQMQHALALLQMPIMELAEAIQIEMEQNPIMETVENEESIEIPEQEENENHLSEKEVNFEEENFEILKLLDDEFRDHFSQDQLYTRDQWTSDQAKHQTFLESLICREETLGEYLTRQARESFENPEQLALAELLIGYLDENGYLSTPCQEIGVLHHCSQAMLEDVLRVMQTFDPAGIGAGSLKESLLLQLERQDKRESVAYVIIRDHWDDLLHHRIPAIAKHLGCSNIEVSNTITDHISKLDLHPASQFSSATAQPITPDVTIQQDNTELIVTINEEPLPQFRFSSRYLRLLEDPDLSNDAREFIKQKIGSAQWIQRMVDQRNNTLYRLVQALAKSQRSYFDSPNGQLKPLTMKSIADELGVHESTIARTVVNKYVQSPRGLLPLRSFFTNAYIMESGQDISSRTVREALEALISKENKSKPLSDHTLSRMLKAQGIPCARRTVAKYRDELRIGNASQRRIYTQKN